MRERICFHKENIIALVLFLLCYIPSVILSDNGYRKPGFFLLLLSALGSYVIITYYSRKFADLRALLCLSWEGGLALAILRLSKLHSPWTDESKISFGLFPVIFLLFSAFSLKYQGRRSEYVFDEKKESMLRKLIIITSAVSFVVFITEVIILGFVPAFSKDTHAYNTFHVTGLHYFTVSSMMTHALTMIYIMSCRKYTVKCRKMRLIIFFNILSAVEAVLCISKLQFLLILGLPVLIFLAGYRVKSFNRLPWKKILILSGVFVILSVTAVSVLTSLRHYEPGYLQEIFEFEDPYPVSVQYPYMYIANNYANFNELTIGLTEHSMGLKQLFPLFALTGLKFICHELINFPLYVVKPEINTLTIIYDAYYDFGIVGVALFGVIMAMLVNFLNRRCRENANPVWYLFYGQICIYFLLSFFSAWFSVATTWFYLGITFLYYICMRQGRDNT